MRELKLSGGQTSNQTPAPAAASQAAAAAVPGKSAGAPRVLLNFAQLQAKLNVSERTARKIIAEPWMCDPVELGPRALRWVEAEVDEALATRAPRRADPQPEPAQLTRGKVERIKRMGSIAGAGAAQMAGA